jgi:hypothetical protein
MVQKCFKHHCQAFFGGILMAHLCGSILSFGRKQGWILHFAVPSVSDFHRCGSG